MAIPRLTLGNFVRKTKKELPQNVVTDVFSHKPSSAKAQRKGLTFCGSSAESSCPYDMA